MKHTYPSKKLLLSTFLLLFFGLGYSLANNANAAHLTSTIDNMCATNVIINELDADTAGTDTMEFVELYDGGVGNMALDGLVLVFYNGSNNLSYAAYDLDGQTTNAEGYFVIGNAAVPNVSIVIPSNGLQNGADAVALYTADGSDFPNGSAVSLTNLEDAMVYDTNDSDDPDLLVLLNAGQEQVNEGGAGDKDGHSSQRIPNGSGGARNTATYAQLAPSPGVANFDPSATPVFIINELDADTAGTDTMEFVEIYDGGVGNSAMDGLVLVFYNGSNNLSYSAFDLDGQSTNAEGYFVIGNAAVPNVDIVIPSNGLQNGADAVALYTGDGTDFPNGSAVTTANLEDALVYDTNDSDDPELLVLLNAGQEQVNEGAAGDKDAHSSQRIPNGDGGARNTDTYAQLEPTPGAANMAPAPVAEVIINELDADTPGTDTMEFVELYDGGVGNTALDGKVLVFYNGSNNLSYAAYDLDGQTTNAQGYFVIGNAAVPNVSLTFSSNGLQNGADAVGLYSGDASDFPSGSAVTTTNLEDAIVYDTNDSDDPDLLVLLNAGEPQVNEGDEGDKDAHSLQRFANGTGGARNTSTYVAAVPTPGASNTNATVPINLIINELDADTAGTDTLEFIELYDGGVGNTSLSGFAIVLYNGNGDTSYNAFDLDGFTTNAEGYFVMGNAAVANVDVVVPSNTFQNGADAAALYQADATSFPNGTAVTTTGLVDALVYDTSDADDAGLLVLLNAGQAQIDEGGMGNKDGDSNQRIPNGAGGARNTATYTQDTPTPGTENGAVVPPPPPISILEARNAAISEVVTVSGVLTVSDQFSGSAYLQDSTAGIAIFDEMVHGDGLFAIGDSITVTGTRSAFNDQVQLNAIAAVENNGLPNVPITPLTITLAELASHPAELVRIVDPSFPTPGDILFGNSNYILTDSSGPGEIRIDNDVAEIVGLGQPETCSELIGVVGRFFEIYQLLPRSAADMSCAGPYEPPVPPVEVPKEQTLDVVTWNIEWFGDESNSPPAGDPNSDAIQKEAAMDIIIALNADIYAVQEISDDALFAQMVSEIPGYAFILSDAVSRPNDPGVKQKIGFIYNTTTVTNVSTKVLLESIHPLYNGGDDSALVGYPSTTDRFYASGRLPFLLTADVVIGGETEPYNVVALHARANGSTGAQERYDMRKYDVEVLKDSLDATYPNANLILLGDYNDDVDETVADVPTTVTTYEEYSDDTINYTIVSRALSDAGFRSFVFRENMIDHIAITDELDDNYIDQTVRVHYEFYDNMYTETASDHFPVSASLQLKAFQLVDASATDVTCNGGSDGTATISVSGGITPYTYLWSDGQTTATATGLSAGIYEVTATDALGATQMEMVLVEEPDPIEFVASEDTTVFFGYGPEECTTLEVSGVIGGTAPYTYIWNTGETTASIEVCPETTATYTVTITDANGCTATADINVEVIDVVCGNPNRPKVEVCLNGRTICIAPQAVPALLNLGATLGSCEESDKVFVTNVRVVPNPVGPQLNVRLTTNIEGLVDFKLYDFHGNVVFEAQENLPAGQQTVSYDVSHLNRGFYFLKIIVDGQVQRVRILFKR
ncbi:MAG: T9SS type A sorting domain-containing protein [Bacteroidota bacterium]